MRLDDIPLFAQLRGRLTWLDQRQRVISQNVANADTPGYAARDLVQPRNFAEMLGGPRAGTTLQRTSAQHISPPGRTPSAAQVVETPESETTLDGNSVVLEEQMLRMAESRMAYDAAIGFYQKSLSMLRMAARPPGR